MIAEPKTECKVSLVRAAIERAQEYVRQFGPGEAHRTGRLLRAAWLSLPKCLVCGAEEHLVSLLMVAPWECHGWEEDDPPGWREPVCVSCRNHPSIRPFEEF